MPDSPNTLDTMLRQGPAPINVGLRAFAESLEAQGVEVVHVDWTPPAGGDTEMAQLLDGLL